MSSSRTHYLVVNACILVYVYLYVDPIIPDLGTYSLEPSYLGRIILNHQDIYIGANETFLSWSYNPDSDSPCAVSRFYKLGLYSRTGSGDVQFLESMDSMKENITINSSLLYSSNSNTLIYFNVSANGSGEACTTTEYLQTFSGLGTQNRSCNIIMVRYTAASLLTIIIHLILVSLHVQNSVHDLDIIAMHNNKMIPARPD